MGTFYSVSLLGVTPNPAPATNQINAHRAALLGDRYLDIDRCQNPMISNYWNNHFGKPLGGIQHAQFVSSETDSSGWGLCASFSISTAIAKSKSAFDFVRHR
jgi:hypothetical protein